MKNPKITLFKTATCPFCHKTAEFFKKHNVKFKEIYVDQDQKAAEEMVKKSGQRGVPVTEIDGQIIVGFDEPALKKALHIK